jgi:hypothetical protein
MAASWPGALKRRWNAAGTPLTRAAFAHDHPGAVLAERGRGVIAVVLSLARLR